MIWILMIWMFMFGLVKGLVQGEEKEMIEFVSGLDVAHELVQDRVESVENSCFNRTKEGFRECFPATDNIDQLYECGHIPYVISSNATLDFYQSVMPVWFALNDSFVSLMLNQDPCFELLPDAKICYQNILTDNGILNDLHFVGEKYKELIGLFGERQVQVDRCLKEL